MGDRGSVIKTNGANDGLQSIVKWVLHEVVRSTLAVARMGDDGFARRVALALFTCLLAAEISTGLGFANLNATLEHRTQTTCFYHNQAQREHEKYATTVECPESNTCFAMVTVKSSLVDGPVVFVQNQGCWKDNAEECHKDACLIEKKGIAVGSMKRQFCCCRGRLCNKNLVDVTAHKPTESVSLPKVVDKKVVDLSSYTKPDTSAKVLCSYFHDGGGRGNGTVGQVLCRGSRKCFAAVVVTGTNSSYHISIASQGCWQDERSIRCNPSACVVGNPPLPPSGKVRPQFCCCYGDLCNNNITLLGKLAVKRSNVSFVEHAPKSANTAESHRNSIILGAISSVFIVSLLAFVGLLLWRYANMKKQKRRSERLKEGHHCRDVKYDKCPQLCMDNLSYGDVVYQGHFSTVRQAKLGSRNVVVKIFPEHSHNLWLNEKEIYTVLNCHANVAKLIAASEVHSDTGIQGMLVLENYVQGSLLQYLQANTLSWKDMITLMSSLADGVAFIHGEVDEYLYDDRVVVAHRDINSRNVLVKDNGTCVLSDFGFAAQIIGREGAPTPEAGTTRYMPPEVLSGAVNWHDWESSLKQADIYSLALVFWEICSRCRDLYRGEAVPKHTLPYECELKELCSVPLAEGIKDLVVHRLCRPAVPCYPAVSPLAHKFLVDTIEECWDHEPEARLTALCVVRRIQHIQDLTDPLSPDCSTKPEHTAHTAPMYCRIVNALTSGIKEDSAGSTIGQQEPNLSHSHPNGVNLPTKPHRSPQRGRACTCPRHTRSVDMTATMHGSSVIHCGENSSGTISKLFPGSGLAASLPGRLYDRLASDPTVECV